MFINIFNLQNAKADDKQRIKAERKLVKKNQYHVDISLFRRHKPTSYFNDLHRVTMPSFKISSSVESSPDILYSMV